MASDPVQRQKLKELKFSRSLVDPIKSVRDKTVKALLDYLRKVDGMDEIEMMKLWKALYYVIICYCYYL